MDAPPPYSVFSTPEKVFPKSQNQYKGESQQLKLITFATL